MVGCGEMKLERARIRLLSRVMKGASCLYDKLVSSSGMCEGDIFIKENLFSVIRKM